MLPTSLVALGSERQRSAVLCFGLQFERYREAGRQVRLRLVDSVDLGVDRRHVLAHHRAVRVARILE